MMKRLKIKYNDDVKTRSYLFNSKSIFFLGFGSLGSIFILSLIFVLPTFLAGEFSSFPFFSLLSIIHDTEVRQFAAFGLAAAWTAIPLFSVTLFSLSWLSIFKAPGIGIVRDLFRAFGALLLFVSVILGGLALGEIVTDAGFQQQIASLFASSDPASTSLTIFSFSSNLLNLVLSLMEHFGYAGVFALMAAESATLPVPSEVVLPLAGYLVYLGKFEFWTTVVIASTGSLIGTVVDYAVGYYLGRAAVLRYGRFVRLNESHLQTSERWFSKYGSFAVLFARFVPLVRTLVAFPAGTGRMKMGKFLAFSAIGILAWDAILVYLGFIAGQNSTSLASHLESIFTPIEVLVTIIIVSLFGIWYVRRRGKGATRVVNSAIIQPESVSREDQRVVDPDSNDSVTSRLRKSLLGVVAGLAMLAVFLLITGLVISGVSQGVDSSLALYINHMNVGSTLNSLFILASKYGREYFWIPVVGLMLLFGKRDTKMLAIELAVLFIAGIVAGEAMKFLMYRPRPFETVANIITRVPIDTDSSYPSGHALMVSIGAIFALEKFRRKTLALLLALEAAMVCYSRVYVGMHYPLDVVSGIFLGGFIVFVGLFVIERTRLKKVVDFFTNLSVRILRGGFVSV
ncbi:MAG: VTT domain-containing protein [Nitrososphaerota archaeon]|nr:VTT domain-containing protein [Nitrososphaerota archaeon]